MICNICLLGEPQRGRHS